MNYADEHLKVAIQFLEREAREIMAKPIHDASASIHPYKMNRARIKGFVTAAVKTSARELGKMGSTVVEEVLTSFTFWFIEEFTMHFASGG